MIPHDNHDHLQVSLTSRPSLPRLRNKASLGRLHVFGGVLDFEGLSTTAHQATPSRPTVPRALSHLYSGVDGTLAGPVVPSLPSRSSEPIMQPHNKQQQQQHTPVKNTNNPATLRALRVLDGESYNTTTTITKIKYPASHLSNGRPGPFFIPALDSDHAPSQAQTQTGSIITQQEGHKQVQSRRIVDNIPHHSSPNSRHSVPSFSREDQRGTGTLLDPDQNLDPDIIPVDAQFDLDNNDIHKLDTRTKKQRDEFEDEERLVREIKLDMDDGGYASLEQILARNGFKVCRVATPPSSGRSQTKLHKHHPHQEIDNTPTISSTQQPVSFHPLSKVISGASSSRFPTSTSASTTTTTQQQSNSATLNPAVEVTSQVNNRTATLKNKTSMLSFSGLVSTIWGSSSPRPESKEGTSSTQLRLPGASPLSPGGQDGMVRLEEGGTEVEEEEVEEGEEGNKVDRNEEIKGWLKQTYDASNTYMNEAMKSIEAARMAMASPPPHKTKAIIESEAVTRQIMTDVLVDSEEVEDDSINHELDLNHERRQGTQSTLESMVLETPTCSPTAPNHIIDSSKPSSTSHFSFPSHHEEEESIIKINLSNPPLYSPPLRQMNIMEPQINNESTYFDSPLVRKKMKRVSLQTRVEAVPSSSSQRRKVETVGERREESTAYPPSPSPSASSSSALPITASDEVREVESGNEGIDKRGKNKAMSAENLLRGTLRHAVLDAAIPSSSKIMEEGVIPQPYETLKKGQQGNNSKNGYRPSISTIFGIPMSFTGSNNSSSSSASSSKEKVVSSSISTSGQVSREITDDEDVGRMKDKLKQSTTESLSTQATSSTSSAHPESNSTSSTSAKDTISTVISGSIPTASATGAGAGPKLLRKTASKHTLRKAASPVLSSNAIIVHRDEIVEDNNDEESHTPVKSKRRSIQGQAEYNDSTPIKAKAAPSSSSHNNPAGIRGPIPLKSPSSVHDSTPTERKNSTGTPRQVAHRNPRDSPIGETKVVRSPPPAISKRFSAGATSNSAINGQQQQGTPIKKAISGAGVKKNHNGSPGIMDDQNDDDGLWSPPRSSSGRAPLGASRSNIQSDTSKGDGKDASQDGKSRTPRLKAKESLERLLAYKQMKDDPSKKGKDQEITPPVPALPTTSPTVQQRVSDGRTKNDVPSTASLLDQEETGNQRKSTKTNTIKHKSSFGGTLRGILGSAVAGWTDSTSISTSTSASSVSTATPSGDRHAPIQSRPLAYTSSSSSSARRITILPAQQPPPRLQNKKINTNGTGRSLRRAKSMYVSHPPDNSSDGNGNYRDGKGNTWIAMGRDGRNSLILPTIIISDYTHD